MTLNDAALTTGATAIKNEVTHLQAHNGAPGAAGTANVVGTRAAAAGTVDADGDITWVANFTGLPSNGPVTHLSYWTAATNGATRGSVPTNAATGDVAANFAGEFTGTAVETSTAS